MANASRRTFREKEPNACLKTILKSSPIYPQRIRIRTCLEMTRKKRQLRERRTNRRKDGLQVAQLPRISLILIMKIQMFCSRLTPLVDYGNGWDNSFVVQRSAHNFITNNNLLNAAFSHCNVCTRNLGMRSLKCNGKNSLKFI